MQDRFYIWINNVMVLFHLGLAIAIFASEPPRFTAASLKPLVHYSNGHMWIWGVWILSVALMMSVANRWVNMVGLWFGMLWHIIWLASVIMAVFKYENAAATGIPLFAMPAAICAALLTKRAIDKNGG